MIFQSTPPVKAATSYPTKHIFITVVISIHAAREGGDSSGTSFPNKCNISIHAAREGGDPADDVQGLSVFHFNPRRP